MTPKAFQFLKQPVALDRRLGGRHDGGIAGQPHKGRLGQKATGPTLFSGAHKPRAGDLVERMVWPRECKQDVDIEQAQPHSSLHALRTASSEMPTAVGGTSKAGGKSVPGRNSGVVRKPRRARSDK